MTFFPLGSVVLAVAQVVVGYGVLALFGDFSPGVVVAVFLGFGGSDVAAPSVYAQAQIHFTCRDDRLVRGAESLHFAVVHGL